MNKRLAKIDRIATEFEKVAKVLVAWGNQDLAKAILKIDPDIIKELKRFGVEQINGSGYVIHHFENAPTTYLSKSRNPDYNQNELAKTLNDKNYNPALREEMIEEIMNNIDSCVCSFNGEISKIYNFQNLKISKKFFTSGSRLDL